MRCRRPKTSGASMLFSLSLSLVSASLFPPLVAAAAEQGFYRYNVYRDVSIRARWGTNKAPVRTLARAHTHTPTPYKLREPRESYN